MGGMPWRSIHTSNASGCRPITSQHSSVPRVSVEPGRASVGPGAITVYEVGTVKQVELDGGIVRTYVSVDGGMSDNVRTALYDAEYTCVLANRVSDATPVLARVVGKHCESGDIVVRDTWLPSDVTPGDLLAARIRVLEAQLCDRAGRDGRLHASVLGHARGISAPADARMAVDPEPRRRGALRDC